MDFDAWLVEQGFDPTAITPGQRHLLLASWRASMNADPGANPTPSPPPPSPKPAPTPNPPPPPPTSGPTSTFDAAMAAIEAENARQEYIRTATVRACEANVGNTQKIVQLKELCAAAIADQKTDVRAFDLALLRADRFAGPIISQGQETQVTDRVIEAAVCRLGRLENLEKHFDGRTLEASDKAFKHGLGLQDLMAMCARRNGWRGHNIRAAIDQKDFWRAAFADSGGHDLMAGSTGPSTYSLPNILGNIANKYMRAGFEAVDQAWRTMSAQRSVSDFKTTTGVSLTGSLIYRKLASSGEINHGTVGELAYTNRADTYAIMLGVDRRDLINDDTGALTGAARRVGRGGALKINDIFWTVFLNNSSFFTAGNANVITGGTSALSSGALKLADAKFRVQTDADGLPIASSPRLLVVPPTLWYTARELMNSSLNVGTTTANTLLPASNIFQGSYQVVTSPYMENTSYTGNSTAAWYLLADPADIPVIEGVFLNGRDTPTVETAEADFNQLGVSWRGYLDFGFALYEYRGGVRAAGS